MHALIRGEFATEKYRPRPVTPTASSSKNPLLADSSQTHNVRNKQNYHADMARQMQAASLAEQRFHQNREDALESVETHKNHLLRHVERMDAKSDIGEEKDDAVSVSRSDLGQDKRGLTRDLDDGNISDNAPQEADISKFKPNWLVRNEEFDEDLNRFKPAWLTRNDEFEAQLS